MWCGGLGALGGISWVGLNMWCDINTVGVLTKEVTISKIAPGGHTNIVITGLKWFQGEAARD